MRDPVLSRAIERLHRDFLDGNPDQDARTGSPLRTGESPRFGAKARVSGKGYSRNPDLGIRNPFPAGGPDPEIENRRHPAAGPGHVGMLHPRSVSITRGSVSSFTARTREGMSSGLCWGRSRVIAAVRHFESKGEAVEKRNSFTLVHLRDGGRSPAEKERDLGR